MLLLRPLALVVVLALAVAPSAATAQHLADHVNTLRGSASDGGYSYGNTFPGVTVPFGFNFWTPISSSNSHSWIYDYRENAIEGFAASHEPSPWIGDHGAFQLMPMIGTLQTGGSARRASYSHANETAHAHYYSVLLDNGIRAEFTPTDHAVVFRFTYPAASNAFLLFDTEDEVGAGNPVQGDVTVDQAARTVSGHVDHRGPRIYYFARVGKAIDAVTDGPNAQAAIRFATSQNEQVVVKLATSFISVAQARANLDQEVGERSFEQVFEAARQIWDDALGRVELEGATEDQKVTFYSNLYRAFMYPNSMWELVDGQPKYFSPYSGSLKDGHMYVNNGFWDTFRAAWPLYYLLVPTQASLMLEGFVNAYRDGGWTPRWSGPGYIDIMVGSHADIVFADAYVKGIPFDVETAYASMLKNALVYSSNGALGRKGQARSIFKGYIPVEDLGESAAWYLEDVINDFGIYAMARGLGDATHARYFRDKSLTYVNLFSPAQGGFFRGRRGDGSFRTSDADFKPNEWGHEFTEGCPWHYIMAAHNDARGMANLYGGPLAMAEKMDALFAAPRDYLVGSYGGVIHEMREAYDTNMGQYAHANEPIHHLLYMYNHAGTPWKTQEHVRAVLDQRNGLYGPGYDGRGYLGDEDNGQMSAWFVFSALGFYPASPGHPEYAIGSPLFPRITLHLESGDFVIDAQGNSDQNRYIQAATLDGAEHTKNFLTHAQLTAGGTLELAMGPEPSSWGSDPRDVPSSITRTTRAPLPMRDRALGGTASASEENAANGEGAAQAFDDDSFTKWLTNAAQGTLTYRFAAERRYAVGLYTLTSGDDEPARDPRSWELQASNDGASWTTLDARSDQSFEFRRQTRVFAADNRTPYAYYRLNVTANGSAPLTQLAELELLGDAPVETAGASGAEPCAADETPEQAVDGKLFTKWCSQQARPELVVDLGRSCVVSQVMLEHAGAGGEDAAWNTRAFELSLSEDGERFELVAGVSDNTESETQHNFQPRDARYVKLAVVTPTQNGDTATRILELETYAQCPEDEEPGQDGGVGDGDGDGGADGDDGDGDGAGDGDDGDGDSEEGEDDSGGDTGDLDCSCGIAERRVTAATSYVPLAVLPLALWLRRSRRRERTSAR